MTPDRLVSGSRVTLSIIILWNSEVFTVLLWSTDTPHVDSTNIIVIIIVFIKCKILPVETILRTYMCTHTHTQAPAHTSILTTQSLI